MNPQSPAPPRAVVWNREIPGHDLFVQDGEEMRTIRVDDVTVGVNLSMDGRASLIALIQVDNEGKEPCVVDPMRIHLRLHTEGQKDMDIRKPQNPSVPPVGYRNGLTQIVRSLFWGIKLSRSGALRRLKLNPRKRTVGVVLFENFAPSSFSKGVVQVPVKNVLYQFLIAGGAT